MMLSVDNYYYEFVFLYILLPQTENGDSGLVWIIIFYNKEMKCTLSRTKDGVAL